MDKPLRDEFFPDSNPVTVVGTTRERDDWTSRRTRITMRWYDDTRRVLYILELHSYRLPALLCPEPLSRSLRTSVGVVGSAFMVKQSRSRDVTGSHRATFGITSGFCTDRVLPLKSLRTHIGALGLFLFFTRP